MMQLRGKNSAQRRRPEDQYLVDAFAAHSANQPFHMTTLPRRTKRGWPVSDVNSSELAGDFCAIGAVMCTGQILLGRSPGERLGDPPS